jgi:hypothetical protein
MKQQIMLTSYISTSPEAIKQSSYHLSNQAIQLLQQPVSPMKQHITTDVHQYIT